MFSDVVMRIINEYVGYMESISMALEERFRDRNGTEPTAADLPPAHKHFYPINHELDENTRIKHACLMEDLFDMFNVDEFDGAIQEWCRALRV